MASVGGLSGTVSLKMMDPNYKNYTENLGGLYCGNSETGYLLVTGNDVTEKAILDDVNSGMNAVADLIDGTAVSKIVNYAVEVEN